MKEIIEVRSNPFYFQKDSNGQFELIPSIELVIIHTSGKNYKASGEKITTSPKIVESRMIVSCETLQDLITDLQLHQKKLDAVRKNADQLNSLVRHIMSEDSDQSK